MSSLRFLKENVRCQLYQTSGQTFCRRVFECFQCIFNYFVIIFQQKGSFSPFRQFYIYLATSLFQLVNFCLSFLVSISSCFESLHPLFEENYSWSNNIVFIYAYLACVIRLQCCRYNATLWFSSNLGDWKGPSFE